MKNYIILTLLIFGIPGFFMTACSEQDQTAEKTTQNNAKIENLATTPEDIKKEAKDLARTTMAYTEEQKTLYMEKIENRMEHYSQKLDELETKLDMMHEQAKADLAVEMEKLQQKKRDVAEKVKELQSASGEAFDDLKDGMDRAMEEMDKAYDKALSRFGEN